MGTDPFTVNFAVTSDETGPHDIPEKAQVVDGKTYRYYAESPDGSQYEWGFGVYDTATRTLSRAPNNTSLDDNSPIDFTDYPIVNIFPIATKSLENQPFDTGTGMVFYQAAAPLGWTKVTNANESTLRVVSGAGGNKGGSVAFSTLFGRTTTDGHALTIAEMPSHNHGYIDLWDSILTDGNFDPPGAPGMDPTLDVIINNDTTGSTGGNQAHVHPLDMRVLYVDVIICTKD